MLTRPVRIALYSGIALGVSLTLLAGCERPPGGDANSAPAAPFGGNSGGAPGTTGKTGGKPAGKRPKVAPAAAGSPNVLVVTLDTTRADRLGCYGYTGGQTPTLDGLATGGTRFDRAYCQVPLTLPSHVSLLTSTFPPSNGVRVNGGGRLGDDVPTLATAFQDKGYRTGAFLGAWVLNAAFGLDRGFDVYDDQLGGTARDPATERTADKVADAALAWLNQEPNTPFFAWVHFFDPHFPYEPPQDYRAKLTEPYDGEIAFMDAQLGRIVQWLDAHGARQRTLIIAVGDHGEAFGEHGEVEHGLFLYDTTLHVPLVVAWPGKVPAGSHIATPVRLVDIAPTVLDLLGWAHWPGLQGASFQTAFDTGALEPTPVYAETEYPRTAFGWAGLRAYIDERWKYIRAPQPELYDWQADPNELNNLLATETDAVIAARRGLDALLAEMPARATQRVQLNEQQQRTLGSLGYVGSGRVPTSAPADETRLRDPKVAAPIARAAREAQLLYGENQFARAAELLAPLVLQSPESTELHTLLGKACFKIGRLPEAEHELRAALAADPNDAENLFYLGDALFGQKRLDEAIASYEQAVTVGDHALAHNRLGTICVQRKQLPQAEAHFRRCVELRPDSANALTNLAGVLAETNRHAEALQLLRAALQQDPKYTPAYDGLSRALLQANRRTEAIALLREGMQALPQEVGLQRRLVMLLATTPPQAGGAPDDAVALAQALCERAANDAENWDTLGLAHAARNDFTNAATAAEKGLALAQEQKNAALAARLRQHLEAYKAGKRP
jgi:arylsulfatase A-like enzyme/Tfp pilus assembly protein PilF